jgi:hypothetical protein
MNRVPHFSRLLREVGLFVGIEVEPSVGEDGSKALRPDTSGRWTAEGGCPHIDSAGLTYQTWQAFSATMA